MTGLFRQSVFGRLGGYEDVNDADRLGRDPAMRWIVGGRAVAKQAASTSQMGRFETEFLAADENLAALVDLSGQWIDLVHSQHPPKAIVLDMDSSVSPTHGDQEGTAYNGHFGCSCYHPLFVFNQFGDLERSELRSGNVHSADGWRGVLEPVVERYRERDLRSSAGVSGSVVMPTSENHGRGVHLDEDEIDIPGAEAPASPSLLQGSPGGDEPALQMPVDGSNLRSTSTSSGGCRLKPMDELIKAQIPDRVRWADPSSYKHEWSARARIAASLLPGGISILEIGTGTGVFRTLVKKRIDYLGADLQPLDAETIALDLDSDSLPDRHFDCVVLLGVFEYLHHPAAAVRKICEAADQVVVSYCCRRQDQEPRAVLNSRRRHG